MDNSTPAVDCAVAAARYYKHFGWPCTAHGAAVWTLAGQSIDAVDVPERFGRAALKTLRRETGCCPQDVVEVPGEPDGTWRFLIAPSRHTRPNRLTALEGHGVVHLTNADRIELPPTRVVGGELSWVRPPLGELFPLGTIVAAVAQVILPPNDHGASTNSAPT